MKQTLEQLTNDIAMYTLVVLALTVTAAFALVLSLFGLVQYPPLSLLSSLGLLVASSYAYNKLLAWTFSASPNRESWLITALILFFLIPPVTSIQSGVAALLVALLAVASKYILAVRGRHLFNPAAIAVVIAGLVGVTYATWWIATPALLPVVFLMGLLVVAKTRRYMMTGLFVALALSVSTLLSLLQGFSLAESLSSDILSGPLIFFATIMLTEPLTSPATRKWQLAYAALVGILYGSQIPWLASPAVALLAGNVLAFAVGLHRTPRLRLAAMEQIGEHVYRIITRPESPLKFTPGQYLELTLPHAHPDSRGVRRTFSIASAPDEKSIEFGIVLAEKSSSFKRGLLDLPEDSLLRVSQLGGDFTMPRDATRPLVLLAGGIGVTPFRSMLLDLLERQEARDIVLMYAANTENSLVYQKEIHAAVSQLHITYVPVIAKPSPDWQGEIGYITPELVSKYVENIPSRDIYISGPPTMVDSLAPGMKKAGANRVVTDHFTGY